MLGFPASAGTEHPSALGRKQTLGKENISGEDFSGTSVMRLFHKCAKGVSSAESHVCSPLVLGILHGTIPPVQPQAEPRQGSGFASPSPGRRDSPGRALGGAFRVGDFTHSAWNSCRGGAKGGRGFPHPQHCRGEQLLGDLSSSSCIPAAVSASPGSSHLSQRWADRTELLDTEQGIMLALIHAQPGKTGMWQQSHAKGSE